MYCVISVICDSCNVIYCVSIVAKSSSTSSAPPTTSGSSTGTCTCNKDYIILSLCVLILEENIKSQVFSGKCPVDPECKNKLGKVHTYTFHAYIHTYIHTFTHS